LPNSRKKIRAGPVAALAAHDALGGADDRADRGVIIFGLLSPNFFKAMTHFDHPAADRHRGHLGCAQSLVVLTAGIDLSVGAIAVFSSVLMGQFTFRYGIPAPISILLGLGLGTLMGFANGWLVAKSNCRPLS
jgi:fructose transport system permease protein